jgi:hypothetical protein
VPFASKTTGRAALAAALILIPLTGADASGTPLAHRAVAKHGVKAPGNGNGNANGQGNGNANGQGNGHANGQGNGNGNGPAKDATPPSTPQPSNTAPAPPAPAPTPPAPVPPAPAAPVSPSPALTPATSLGTTASAPKLGAAVGLAQVGGRVAVRTPAGRAPQDLPVAAAAVPVGTHVDARQGTVELAAATDATGTAQVGRFSGGVFAVRQTAGSRGMTQLVLLGGDWHACRRTSATTAHAAAKRRPVRSLWGSDSGGKFQTRGAGSVATVRGTRWLTEDFCDGTRTTVAEGAVSVHDQRRHRTVVVTAGHSYFAAIARR